MITSASYRSGAYPTERNASNNSTEMDVLRVNHDDEEYDTDEESGSSSNIASTGELAGIYLGVLNVYTTIPQFVGTFISWIVFSVFEPGGTTDGGGGGTKLKDEQQQSAGSETTSRAIKWMKADKDAPNAIAICLFIGAISALVAAEATRRLRYVGSGTV